MSKSAAKYSIMTQEMVDSFCENFYIPAGVHPTAPGRNKTITQFPTDMDLLDFLQTADPRKVRAVEVQKGADQVKLLESTKDCFMPLVIPAAGGSSSAMAEEVPAPTEGGQEGVTPEDVYLNLEDPGEDATLIIESEEEVVAESPKKVKKRRLVKQSETLPAKRLRGYHSWPASSTDGKTLSGLEQLMPEGSSTQTDLRTLTAVERAPTTSKAVTDADLNLGGPSHPEESEESDDSFYEAPIVDPSEAKRWYVPKWNITYDSLLDDAFSCHTLVDRVAPPAFFSDLRTMKYDQMYKEFNLLEEKDLEIVKLKSQLEDKEFEAAEVILLRDQVASLSGENSALAAEVSALKVTAIQKDHDISLLDSRAIHLKSALNDAKAACAEAGTKITLLASERDRLASEVSSLHAGFKDFNERMVAQQEVQGQELYNRVAELEAHVMDVFGRLEGEFYPTNLTLLAGRRWLLTYGIKLALLKCLKSSEYQGTLGHALGRAIDFGMQEGLEAGHEHGVAGRSLSAVDAYDPEAAKASYIDSPCLEQLTVPIHHSGDKTVFGETSLSFALMNVYSRAEGAKKHVAALRKLMIDIVSDPLSSQTWVGEASTSATPLSVEDYDEEHTDEALGSVIAIPKLEVCRF
ncbi:hypothetical protein Tco_1346888 [Tanacetum coccineum]